mmetsp:Transcript_47235/g.100473  ORF Transcript_47235/g.100473 Transcript_47235/m.100473 type:complete len:181 (-) Transcript_47235:205-747(-)|eukprot:CAMPEP_0172552718 /NCGR_PEP_ID=MMETSP1067-20121228/47108_1 /TAXON_ID=265564 ORGANISM="Thalassiosira punctigera, Strain Tpunct2005C2" /NCGR_SAMPLE_ID=MMETSP1067 /ASSEMBLY_ACC=CAM_ASM_000444 /LENGTH=180 /DNA_ID=CAMNT_0013340767 /DNA_START=107 /DNA_END=649 /DNA_ORIENTATION=-
MASPPALEDIVLLHGGELSSDVASKIASEVSPLVGGSDHVHQISMSKSKHFKAALVEDTNGLARHTTLAIFVAQTIENEAPTEDAGACIRYFKRKTHPETLLKDKVNFAVLGLGDSNLLLDRQHTSAKDCNQVAQALDSRLKALGGTRFCDRGECDERTGLMEVEPWIQMLVSKIKDDEE